MYLCCCLFNFQHEFGHWLSSGIIQIRKHLVYLECTLIDSYNCKVTFKKAMTTLGLACVLLSSCQSTRPKVASETITDQTFSEGGHAQGPPTLCTCCMLMDTQPPQSEVFSYTTQ